MTETTPTTGDLKLVAEWCSLSNREPEWLLTPDGEAAIRQVLMREGKRCITFILTPTSCYCEVFDPQADIPEAWGDGEDTATALVNALADRIKKEREIPQPPAGAIFIGPAVAPVNGPAVPPSYERLDVATGTIKKETWPLPIAPPRNNRPRPYA